ncbi:MAG: hypothetical protein N2312_04015 [Dictyoglomaceae bacterium]|nr:hypothetical protein [Dictyoglomaceae bacterium]
MGMFCSSTGCRKVCKSFTSISQSRGLGTCASKIIKLMEKAKILDNFYIPSRYPNGHPEELYQKNVNGSL